MMPGMPMGGMPSGQEMDPQKQAILQAMMQQGGGGMAQPQQGGELAAMQNGQAPAGGNSDMLRQMMMQIFQSQMAKQQGNDAAMGAGPM